MPVAPARPTLRLPMRLDDLDYDLPEHLVARHPPERRDAGRLLLLDRKRGSTSHHRVSELPSLLPPRSLLVLNDTRVLPARLLGRRPTGGRVELLLLEPLDGEPQEAARWTAMGRANRPLRPGDRVEVNDRQGTVRLRVEVEAVLPGGLRRVLLRPARDEPPGEAVEAAGRMPLPPYLGRDEEPADRERYQTVFARRPGAVAAPTAGLHLSEALLEALRAAGHDIAWVTLHVGAGTFRPIRAERLEEHEMHRERYEVPEATAAAVASARAEGRPVVAVGTTVVRTLESAADETGRLRPGPGTTALFIRPGYRFRVVEGLMTNFHLPRSTLLALVMAFGGVEPVRAAYREAVERGYRFYSYGDAMLLR